MRDVFRIRFCISALTLGFPACVYAAEYATPLDIPLIKYGYVLLMGLWGALAALLQRLAKGEEPRWKIVIARDITNATLAAVLVFLLCEHFSVPPALGAVGYTLAGYGGARFMEFAYLKFLARFTQLVGEKNG